MNDALRWLWPYMEVPRPLIADHLSRAWPDDALRRLRAAGFVAQAENARCVMCPGCAEGHIEDVVAIKQSDGSCRFYVYCPEVLRAEVSVDELRHWTIDLKAIAVALGRSMLLQGKCLLLVPGRLWRLGRAPWRDGTREVLFARGLTWQDAARVVDRVSRSRDPIVLVPYDANPAAPWGARRPAIVPLDQIAAFKSETLVVDTHELAAIVFDADAKCGRADEPHIDKKQLRRIMRAQREVALSDEVYVAAYKQHGSYRKAAEALVAHGVETDRWAIERAVRRAGGARAVRRDESSSSVVRAEVAAAQRCDTLYHDDVGGHREQGLSLAHRESFAKCTVRSSVSNGHAGEQPEATVPLTIADSRRRCHDCSSFRIALY